MYELSKKIIELRIATRRACMCEPDKSKQLLSLKTKILFLVDKSGRKTPAELISDLKVNKSNLAILTRELCAEGLLDKNRDDLDRREITYALTGKGREYLAARMEAVEKMLKTAFPESAEYTAAAGLMDEVLHILSFLPV